MEEREERKQRERESKGYKSNERGKRGEIKIDMIEGGEQCDDIEERKRGQIEERGNER